MSLELQGVLSFGISVHVSAGCRALLQGHRAFWHGLEPYLGGFQVSLGQTRVAWGRQRLSNIFCAGVFVLPVGIGTVL